MTVADSPAPIDVVFVLLPGSLVLDWAGPAEALRSANAQLAAQGLPARFRLRFVGLQTQATSSVGAVVAGLEPLPATLPAPCWLVLVGQPGATIDLDTPEARAALHWLRGLRPCKDRLELLCVCAGTLLAAHAGLLAGRRATTHHHHLDELRTAEPACEVVANRVFVDDAPVWSSAGVTCGVDLTLHRIAQACGPALAAAVAQALVVGWRRGPQDSEFSPFLAHRAHLHAALHRVQNAIAQAPRADWSQTAMARVAHTSPRHLARLFAEHAGVSPQDYLRSIRLGLARRALSAGHTVSQAAELAGFSSDAQLRRAWRASGLPGAPSQAGS